LYISLFEGEVPDASRRGTSPVFGPGPWLLPRMDTMKCSNKFCISLGSHYLSPLVKVLSLENAQINLALCSLIRTFAVMFEK